MVEQVLWQDELTDDRISNSALARTGDGICNVQRGEANEVRPLRRYGIHSRRES
jgi:hypothetical protein